MLFYHFQSYHLFSLQQNDMTYFLSLNQQYVLFPPNNSVFINTRVSAPDVPRVWLLRVQEASPCRGIPKGR